MKRVALPVAATIAVIILALSFVPHDPTGDRPWMASATTYSPGPRGSKALFLLLGKMGLDVDRLRRPAYDELSPGTVLWVLSRESFGRTERRQLVTFLRKGGTLIAPPRTLVDILEDEKLGQPVLKTEPKPAVSEDATLEVEDDLESIDGLPEPLETYAKASSGVPVVAAWKIGEGRAVSLGVDRLAQNANIGRPGNGPFLVRLAFALGRNHVFDEFKTGFGEGDLLTLLMRVPYRWGLAQLALVGLVGVALLGRRRLPPDPPAPIQRRRTLDHVEAVARLWEEGQDAGLPLRAILSAVDERARARLGGAGAEKPFVRWIERVRPDLAPRTTEVWARAERLGGAPRPPPEDARRVCSDIKTLEREAIKW